MLISKFLLNKITAEFMFLDEGFVSSNWAFYTKEVNLDQWTSLLGLHWVNSGSLRLQSHHPGPIKSDLVSENGWDRTVYWLQTEFFLAWVHSYHLNHPSMPNFYMELVSTQNCLSTYSTLKLMAVVNKFFPSDTKFKLYWQIFLIREALAPQRSAK